MKKKLCMIAAVLALAAGCALPVSAATIPPQKNVTTITNQKEETIYFEDGSYIVTTTVEEVTPISRAVINKIFKKTSTSYDASNKARCALTVVGSFEVNMGVSVKCLGVRTEKNIYQNGWSIENVSTSYDNSSTSKATAIASGNFVKRQAGIAVQSIPVTVKVTCDKNGNAS